MRKVMLVLAVAALAVLGMSCNQLKARDQLNKGVQAFTAAQYPEAVERFKTAVELDPGFSAARLYLATAYMQQYIPGSTEPENVKMATAAFDNFKKVLEQEPKNAIATPSAVTTPRVSPKCLFVMAVLSRQPHAAESPPATDYPRRPSPRHKTATC